MILRSRKFIAFLVLVLTFSAVNVRADKIEFPTANPNFSIDFPKDWMAEPSDGALHAGPKDKSLYFGILPIPPETDGDKIGEVIGGIVGEMVSELGEGKDTQVEINGIKFFITDARGKAKEGGESVDVSFGFFSPNNDGKEINALIYFGTPDAGAKHEKEIESILSSIHSTDKG